MGRRLATVVVTMMVAMVSAVGTARAADADSAATATSATTATTVTTASPSSAGGFSRDNSSNNSAASATSATSETSAAPAAPAPPPVRIDPVEPERPVSERCRQLFDQLFGQEMRTVQAAQSEIHGLTLAEKIFDDVRQGKRTAEFVGYCLDQVVSLASASPDGGLLAYNALGAQKSMLLRPRGPCLEKMMFLAPRTFEELPPGRHASWLNGTWGRDAAEYAVLLAARGREDQAARVLDAVATTASQVNLAPPQALDAGRDGIEFFKGITDSLAKAQADLAEPGEHPAAHLALGINKLVRDKKPAEAAAHFRVCGHPAGLKLATALDMASSGGAGDTLGLARAEAALAGEVKEPYFKLLLWQQAADNIEHSVGSIDLSKDERQAGLRLRDEAAVWLTDLGAQLPPLVAAELAAGAVKPVELADEETETRQSFFGIPFRQAKRVVYLVDCSTSSSAALDLLKTELGKSVAALAGEQSFSIVFCGSTTAQVLPGGLVAGSGSPKDDALKFIEAFAPRGRANAKDGLAKAFAMSPTVICLLTDGDPGAAAVKQVADLNRRHGAVVHTLAFGNPVGAGVLREIAAANGGAYRFVGERLAPPPPPGPMPVEDHDRLDRLIGYLEKNAGDPLPKLQKTVELAKNLLDKYGESVPEPLRKRAEKVFARLGV